MNTFFSKLFYLITVIGFGYAFYNAALAVNSLFQKSSEASGPVFQESWQFIYIAAGSFLASFIFLIIGRKLSKNT